jgi:S1-C subfamily serine protease
LDIRGRAIALNAGGASTSSSSYYFPLDRVLNALKLIQENKPISRGTLQTTFEYQSYDTLLQLGLSRHLEKRLRSQQQQQQPENVANEGLLVVKSVLPDGPAFGYLEPGDILLTCNSELLPRLFIDLEACLDDAIEKKTTITIVVSRAGELKEFSLSVQDLHSVTPFRYLEFGGGVLNDLSYQMARSFGLSLQNAGVYVGAAGFILGTARALRKSIIVGINNKQVRSLDDFIEAVSSIDQGERVPIRYYSLPRPMKVKVMIAHIDWRWHKLQLATRNGKK